MGNRKRAIYSMISVLIWMNILLPGFVLAALKSRTMPEFV